MESTQISRSSLADPMGNPMAHPMGDPMRPLIARTDGRTNERGSHLLNKSSSYVISGKRGDISFTHSGGDCE